MANSKNSEKSPKEGKKADHQFAMCSQPRTSLVVLPPTISRDRALAIWQNHKKWLSVTVLHYCFIDRISDPSWFWTDEQKKVVRDAFQIWKDVGIGLQFTEVDDVSEAEIKIGCEQNNRSWSYVGTDCLEYDDLGRTMNFGWDLRTPWGHATALHEIGHALGLEHEHQNPNSGIIWNEPAVFEYYRGHPNYWEDDDIRHNVLSKIPSSRVRGSKWDAESNMHYPVRPGLIVSPKPYDLDGIGENYGLSRLDKLTILEDYPPETGRRAIAVMQLEPLPTEPGSQTSFTFSPKSTRKFKIQTVGLSDTRLVIFEERNNEPRHHKSSDDSGFEHNNLIETKLISGRTYIIGVRTNFSSAPDGISLLIT
ncbi:M12 family metallopeptidase [Methylobacterium oryzisoli]|uniref:M12 family metallopeptidase n=1 Tax=Methylobacterium oryzisoli TaxID=3385502 RepID=UPI003891FAE9